MQIMFMHRANYKYYASENEDQYVGDFVKCTAYREQKEQLLAEHPGVFSMADNLTLFAGAEYFPLVAFSDTARVYTTRVGKSVHPIYLTPARLPRSLRRQHRNKYLIGFISTDADYNEALEEFGTKFRVHHTKCN